MKVFFDTNVYVAEALLGGAAEQIVATTISAKWRIFVAEYVLDETERVLTEKLGFSRRFALMTRQRLRRRATIVGTPASRHQVVHDPADSPVLRAALAAGADMLVTNDRHLLQLNPYEGLRVISMNEYFDLLTQEGLVAGS